MSSPSVYASSSSSSSFSPASHQSGSDLDQPPPRPSHSRARQPPPQRNPPPRLPSPRIFRDFFTAMSDTVSRRQATLPPATFQNTMQDVRSAIQRASRALENAQEALQSRAMNPRSEVVDLTGSPPDRSSESRFISRTTHPHDSSARQASRRMNTLHEPIYGPPPRSSFTPDPNEDPSDSLSRARNRRIHPNRSHLVPTMLRRPAVDPQEEQAIRRQRENHHAWERTQARARELQTLQRRHSTPNSTPSTSASSSPISSVHQSLRSRRSSSLSGMSSVEAVDLTAVEDNTALAEALSKQRSDAVASQKLHATGSDEGRTVFSAYKCPICMDTPKNATTTICGHLFCHRCIVDTLKWSAEQRREEGTRKSPGVCPVCRKPLNIKDAPGNGRTLVPLELKFLTKKRKRDEKGKQKVRDVSDDEVYEVVGKDKEGARRGGKAKKRESTDEALWGEFIND